MLDGAAAVAIFVFNATALFVLVYTILPRTDTCTGTSTWFVGTTRLCMFPKKHFEVNITAKRCGKAGQSESWLNK